MKKGDVLCHRKDMVPCTEIFEAEMELLELLPYKPIMSRGYTCMIHMHTYADECVIKDIMFATEKNNAGVPEDKAKPQYIRSFAKCTVRIMFKKPIALEKFDVLPQLGRFTLRDEGRTIALGRVLKYKPASGSGGAAAAAGLERKLAATKITASKTEEPKAEANPNGMASIAEEKE